MSNAAMYFKQAELALAAYADLQEGVPSVDALTRRPDMMTEAQAIRFAANWKVIKQYKHPSNQPTSASRTS